MVDKHHVNIFQSPTWDSLVHIRSRGDQILTFQEVEKYNIPFCCMTIIKIGRHANPKNHTDVLKLRIRVHIFTPEV